MVNWTIVQLDLVSVDKRTDDPALHDSQLVEEFLRHIKNMSHFEPFNICLKKLSLEINVQINFLSTFIGIL